MNCPICACDISFEKANEKHWESIRSHSEKLPNITCPGCRRKLLIVKTPTGELKLLE